MSWCTYLFNTLVKMSLCGFYIEQPLPTASLEEKCLASDLFIPYMIMKVRES